MHGAHVAVHAAQEQRKNQEEEEEMTSYTRQELEEDFEFKIIRSSTGTFKKREAVEQLKAEEGMSGWVMVEKFDDNRIRFKRPLSAQKNDAMLPDGIDPYRSKYGMSEGAIAFVVMGVLALVGGTVALFVFLLN